MSAQLQIEFAGIQVRLAVDDTGIDWQGIPRHEFAAWNQITGAVVLRDDSKKDLSLTEVPAPILQRMGGPGGFSKLLELQSRYGQIRVAYRDGHNSKQVLDIPYEKANPVVLTEIQNRLGNRWLGEARNSEVASQKLKLNPGALKTLFFFFVFLLILAIAAVFALNVFLGPVFNLLSIQRMLLNLQDGEYGAFATGFSFYIVLFILAFLARRAWRSKLAAWRTRPTSVNPHFPFHSPHEFQK